MNNIGFEPLSGKRDRMPRLRDGRRRNGGLRSPAGGRPKWQPSGKQRNAIRDAAGRGLSQDLIANLLGISESTLKRHCADELRYGAEVTCCRIAMVATEMAMSGEHPFMTRWWLRVRAGWK